MRPAVAGTTERVSVAFDGTQANGWSYSPSISADGLFVAFESEGSNLVTGDTNGYGDIFVHDRQTGQTTRVSVASDGTQGNSGSYNPSISADGRFVGFVSHASNLVAGDTNGDWDIFVHDRQTGETTRVSVASDGTQGNDHSYDLSPSISADGRFVAFESRASDLVPGDTNGLYDIFVHDRETGETTRVSVASDGTQGNGDSSSPSVSADGRFVAFHSEATNLVPGDTNGTYDTFIHDRDTRETTRVSVASDGTEGNSFSFDPSISADGRFVAFESRASNLVAGDTNYRWDIFVHDRQTGETTRVSVASDGAQGEGGNTYELSLSPDGRFVAFASAARNLVPGDANRASDIFVHDRQTGETTHVSVASDGTRGNWDSYRPSISADGRYVAFRSTSSNLVPGDTDWNSDILVHDRFTVALAVVISGNGTGAVDLNPPGGVYDDGTTVTLTAQPSPDSMFDHWEGDLAGSENPAAILMEHYKTVVAYFTRPRLAVLSAPIIDVAIGGTYAGQTPYAADRDYAEMINLTAPASVSVGDSDYPFACWFVNGQQQEEGQTLELMMDGDKAAVAQYDWRLPGDLTGDCTVTVLDMLFVRDHLNTTCSESE